MAPSGKFYADVILPLPLRDFYTYAVPEEFESSVTPGVRVVVQFGQQKLYAAVVFRVHQQQPKGYDVKPVMNVLDEIPVLTTSQLKSWQWISDYYLCSPGEIMLAALPSALRLQSESRIVRNESFEGDTSVLDDREFMVWEALELQPELSLKDISKILSIKHVIPVLRSMIHKGVIRVLEEVQEKYKPRHVDYISLHPESREEESLGALMDSLERKAPRQLDLLLAFFQLTRDAGQDEVNKAMLLKKSGAGHAALHSLIKKQVLVLETRREDRLPHFRGTLKEPFQLNQHQQQALLEIQRAFAGRKVTLLHGVTSSGKTEVYIHLIREQLGKGKQVLYLLPEIALTTQLIQRLLRFFGSQLLVYHSRFNEQERLEVWTKVLSNNLNTGQQPFLVIGARSAVFLPFERLGLVIVDEEHDHSYKQEDPAPRYNARDLAVVTALQQDAEVLLGTATPSMESFFNALSGKYALVTLDRRHAGLDLPDVHVVDLRDVRKRKQVSGHFSHRLLERIKEVLSNKEQVILFQNRRGFSPFLECGVCAWVPECVNCDVALTYHKSRNELKCHYCGYVQSPPVVCAACGDQDIRMRGFGTERIEEDLQILLPEARIARLDYDTTRNKNDFQKILGGFEDGEIDILVGTQMVTKGLDFDRVSLVGILNADSILHYPEFRANERGFHLLTQVSGRAGRKKPGEVIIQTYNPDSPVLKFVLNHDYAGFYRHELNERFRFHYPPYCRLVEIRLRHRHEQELDRMCMELGKELRKTFKGHLLGPTIPYVNRVRNQYLRNFLLKIDKTVSTREVKQQLFAALEIYRSKSENRSLSIALDVDPV
jgi:primosomal protein N' (replication factor Y)